VLLEQFEKASSVMEPETAKTAGRGVITSRTSLSPNSTAERTSSRSLSSRMPSSSPASISASTSTAGSSSSLAGSSASSLQRRKKRMKTVMGVMSHKQHAGWAMQLRRTHSRACG
jgi:hypothetical protein